MLEIEYKGGNCVVLTTKDASLVVDSKLSEVGLKDVAKKGAIELSTEPRLAARGEQAKLVIDGPGEYEVGGFSIHGISAQRHIDTEKEELISTIYRIETVGVRLALLGNIADTLSDAQLEALGVVDILLLPVGGGGLTLDSTAAAHLSRQIDPKVVIPLHFADDSLKYEMPQENVEVFTKELSVPIEKVTKYKIKGTPALPVTMTVVEIARS